MKRRADVFGIFPDEDSIIRLVGAVLLEQNDEWQLQHCYMQIEGNASRRAADACSRPDGPSTASRAAVIDLFPPK